jgi:arylsulfatase A-like enzyme
MPEKFNYFLMSLLAVISLLSCDGTMKVSTNEKPNIIYIMADDLTTQAISAYSDIYKELAPTPNIDRIADEGMIYKNAMCTNAICGPSRASILTGNYSNKNGYYKNESGGEFNANQWTFPQEFQAQGYKTALFGKWHLGSNPRGFDKYMYHTNSGQQGTYWDPIYDEDGKKIRKKGYATNLTTDAALKWLETNRNENKPFLMLLQFKAPHRPWDPDSLYQDLWDDIKFPYPKTFDDNYKGREMTAGNTEMTMDYLCRRDMKMKRPEGLEGEEALKWDFYGTGKNQIVKPDSMSMEQGRKWRYQVFIKDYLACVKSVDDNIGRVLDFLKKSGLADNTIIILTSDQGFYLGDHGFLIKDLYMKNH